MLDILFSHSYYYPLDKKQWENKTPYPPLGTIYAASLMRENDFSVSLFDTNLRNNPFDIEKEIQETKPSFLVIYDDGFNYLTKMCLTNMREAAFEMIDIGKKHNCRVIVNSSDSTDHYKKYLDAGADYIILGEGELTLKELLTKLKNKEPASDLKGIVFKNNEEFVTNSKREALKNLDELPMPAWDLVDVDAYKKVWAERGKKISLNIATTRGCPFKCNWCAKPIWGQRYNVRDAKIVAQEMQYLQQTYKAEHIWFVDDIMGLRPGWFNTLASELKLMKVDIPFKCLSRADLILRGDTIESLARAGCDIIWLGAESGSQKVLDAMDKGTKVEEIYEATRRLRAAGVRVAFFLQFGYPGEKFEDIKLTLKMLRECAPDEIGISVSYPLPGTKFYDAVKRELSDKQNWTDSADLDMMYRGTFVTDFYRQLHTVVHKEFKALKTLRYFKHAVRTPKTLGKRDLRRVAGMFYRASTLPLAWKKLKTLSLIPNEGLGPLPTIMSHEEAAVPSPQSD